jgi:hypothetical protein
VVKDATRIASPELAQAEEKAVLATVDRELGAIARPSRVHFVQLLPKTRSGKLLAPEHSGIGRRPRPGDLTTLEDPRCAGADSVRPIVRALQNENKSAGAPALFLRCCSIRLFLPRIVRSIARTRSDCRSGPVPIS